MRSVFIFFLCLLVYSSYSNNYYFAISGNDANNGTSSKPYQTLKKLNNILPKALPGDSFLFKSDEYFYGSILTSVSGTTIKPVYFGTYGGIKPAVITGAILITNWQYVGNNIYASQPLTVQSTVNNVILDNASASIGRYPNDNPNTGGFMQYGSFGNYPGNSVISFGQAKEYGIDSSWIGATIKIKSYLSTLESGKILNINGGFISFDNTNMFYQLQRNYCGFFITNSVKTLDLPGEWFYDTTVKRVYMYFRDNPNLHKVEVSTIDITLEPRNNNYVFDNLVFYGANKYGISCNYASRTGLKLNKVKVIKSGITGVAMANLTGFIMDGCIVDGCNTTGINVGNKCDKVRLLNTVVNNCGMIPANILCDAKYQKRMAYGIYSDASATQGLYMENCKVTNTGFIGVYFTGSNNTIYRNHFENNCAYLDDGGAIYYANAVDKIGTNNLIRRNTVINCKGYHLGFPFAQYLANAIFIDDAGCNAKIDSNYIDGRGQTSIYIHNAYNVSITNNVCIGANLGLIAMMDGSRISTRVYNVSINNNDLYQPVPGKFIYVLYGDSGKLNNNIMQYCSLVDYNHIATPDILLNGYVAHADTFNVGTDKNYNLAELNNIFGFDKRSIATNIRGREIRSFYAVDKDTAIQLNGTWMKLNGQMISGKLHLIDHTGVILIKVPTT